MVLVVQCIRVVGGGQGEESRARVIIDTSVFVVKQPSP